MDFSSLISRSIRNKIIESILDPKEPEMYFVTEPTSGSCTVPQKTSASDSNFRSSIFDDFSWLVQLERGDYIISVENNKRDEERDEIFTPLWNKFNEENEEKFPLWLSESLERIANFRELPNNWDSYGSPTPAPELCDKAMELLFDIRKLDISTLFISPSTGGLIYIEIKCDHRELEIELFDKSGRYADCLCVETLPRGEKTREETIYLKNEFREMVLWVLGQSDQQELAA